VPCRYAQLRELGGSATSVLAWRAGRWETLSSEALVPGDLIALSRSPPGFVDGVDSICPARHLTRDPTDACRIGASWLRGPAVTGGRAAAPRRCHCERVGAHRGVDPSDQGASGQASSRYAPPSRDASLRHRWRRDVTSGHCAGWG
jgi:hypothetical protein